MKSTEHGRSGRGRAGVVVVTAVVVALLAGITGPAHAAMRPAAYERTIVTALNQLRDARGLSPVRVQACVDRISEAHAVRMRRTGRLRPVSATTVQNRCGRRLRTQAMAATIRPPAVLLRAWTRDRKFRRAVLSRGARAVGVGAVRGGGRWYVSLLVVGGPTGGTGSTDGGSGDGGSGDGTDEATTRDELETEILAETNRRRDENGLKPLKGSACAGSFAGDHSHHMAETGELSHADLDALRQRCEAADAAENVAMLKSAGLDVERLVDLWMESPLHRGNILDPKLTHLGAGVAYAEGDGRWYVTQEFLRL
jgi:uncharacterized protein YkwD